MSNEKHCAQFNAIFTEKVSDDPLRVRLNFEPQGRPDSQEDYYLQQKDNICVVCGSGEHLIRKQVIPKEYRRYCWRQIEFCRCFKFYDWKYIKAWVVTFRAGIRHEGGGGWYSEGLLWILSSQEQGYNKSIQNSSIFMLCWY